jgi:hypothetical protein
MDNNINLKMASGNYEYIFLLKNIISHIISGLIMVGVAKMHYI